METDEYIQLMENFRNNLRKRRGKIGLTTKELEQKAAKSRARTGQMIRDYEAGTSTPSFKIMCRIARALRTSVVKMMGNGQ